MTRTGLSLLTLLTLGLCAAIPARADDDLRAIKFMVLHETDYLADEDRDELISALESKQDGWIERLVKRLGRNRLIRHRLADLVNARGGYLDRLINNRQIKKAWLTSPHPNLDTVGPDLMRGGQPNLEGYQKLKAMGVTTVVNLRMEDNSEKAMVEGLGMAAVHIAMPDTRAPTPEQVAQFHQVMSSNTHGKVFIHCAAGSFRTSVMAGIYRLDRGESLESVFEDAKAHGWDPEFLYGDEQEAFLTEYAAARGNRVARVAASALSAAGSRSLALPSLR